MRTRQVQQTGPWGKWEEEGLFKAETVRRRMIPNG
jgi:hypothetical protein